MIADVGLEVAEGNILDFSALSDTGPAGKFGWASVGNNGGLRFEQSDRCPRFFCASFQFSPSNGGFPSKDDCPRLVAQLKRTGYNAVRFQCVEANLMSGRDGDFDYSPDQFDRFHFFLARLKEAGIYVVSDFAYNDNAAYGAVRPHRWVKKYAFRRDLFVSEDARVHWKRLVTSIFGIVNPYTGIAPIHDPALLCVVLSNEGGIIELMFREGGGWNATVPRVYQEPFRDWLIKRYGATAVWRKAWGSEAKPGESLEADIALPSKIRGSSPRQIDFMRFVVDLEQSTYDWMIAHIRGIGYKGLVTSYNNWSWVHSDITRTHVQVVDMHSYHAHPTGFVEAGSTVPGDSSLPKAAEYVRSLASSRQWGKPFFVTEYGHAFWNGFRREACALVPAYAALQQWDLITQFSENSVQLSYGGRQPSRLSAIFPFTISTDPIRRSGERLAALLYARGDVAPAKRRIEFRIRSEDELRRNGGWSQLNETASRMSLVSGTGIRIDDSEAGAGRTVMRESDDFLVDKTKLGYQVFSGFGSAFRKKTSAAGLMDEKRWAAFDGFRYGSDTGELELDASSGRFTINTPKTVVLLGSGSDARIGPLGIGRLSAPALIAVSSMDDQPLVASRRMLVFVLTDAINSGMAFQDAARTRLQTLGSLPARIQPVSLELRLVSTVRTPFSLFALAQNGRRLERFDVRSIEGILESSLDTSVIRNGPSALFELVSD